MPVTLDGALVVAVSTRALFDFEEENRVYEQGGADADIVYSQFQLERLEKIASHGVAYPLVRKLLAFNESDKRLVEVVVLSRNDPVSGLRVFRSAQHHGLPLERGVFTRGIAPFPYLIPLNANLFLSAEANDVREALKKGFPAARVIPRSLIDAQRHPNEVRIAFDGDAVLFSDEAESVYQEKGLDAFQDHERIHAHQPLPPGPFKPFLEALHKLQQASRQGSMRVRTALVTARGAPAHERAIRTLMQWGISVDEAMFLGGLEKGPFLKEFQPDFYFDDQTGHCESAATAGPAGHVLSGVANSGVKPE